MKQELDLENVRARLAGKSGQRYWRSLDELANNPGFDDFLKKEFPRQSNGWLGPVSRREFLKTMGAGLALAGLTSCGTAPAEQIIPYVNKPEIMVPGRPLFYATAMSLGGYAVGLLAESHEGRPTKIEGNPSHPASLGAADVFSQASVLSVYDPDRSQAVLNLTRPSTWQRFVTTLQTRMQALAGSQGAGLRVLTEATSSPTLIAQMTAILSTLPQARWTMYDPVGQMSLAEATNAVLGQNANVYYRFDRATRVLSLDSDFLLSAPGTLRYARDFIGGRRIEEGEGQTEMNRLYVAESSLTNTGATADHRVRVRASDMDALARAIATGLGVNVGGAATPPAGASAEWIAAVVADLQSAAGRSIVLAGDHLPASVHAIVHAINNALGNFGQTVIATDPVLADPGEQGQTIQELVADMNAGTVTTLIILGGNPVFDAPAELDFRAALDNQAIDLRAHLSMYEDETSEWCQWHIPQVHYLEEWSDARAYDGTVSIVQPLIAPLFNGISAHQILDVMAGNGGASNYDIVQAYWSTQYEQPNGDWPELTREGSFDDFWQTVLHDGIVQGTAAPAITPSVNAEIPAAPAAAEGIEVIFKPDPGLWDGRFANNAWLQELPRPITTITWDNVALMSAATAGRLGVTDQDVVTLTVDGRNLPIPVWRMAGHADNSITINLGFGRSKGGSVSDGTGKNAYAIRTSTTMGIATGVSAAPTGETYTIAATQENAAIPEDRVEQIIRVGTIEEYRANPNIFHGGEPTTGVEPEAEEGTEQAEPEHADEEEHHPSMLAPWDYSEGYAWGMAINLNACIGCNACVVGCQSENNIPTVGKKNVERSREMHWLKIDRYFEGTDPDNPLHIELQPRTCMHCEKAPCELVCPVGATSHSSEGLNEMTYNRCVGTKYCSNNCPYKVRRYNFLDYTKQEVPVLRLMANPDVTIRSIGVMEKCSYCVQRIELSRISSDNQNRTIQDGEIKTACQETCPTNAIVFGNINDPNSEVARLKATNLNFTMLDELGVLPRTSYLARVRNPNTAISTETA